MIREKGRGEPLRVPGADCRGESAFRKSPKIFRIWCKKGSGKTRKSRLFPRRYRGANQTRQASPEEKK